MANKTTFLKVSLVLSINITHSKLHSLLNDYDTVISPRPLILRSLSACWRWKAKVKCKSNVSSWSPRGWQKGARGLSLGAASIPNFFTTSAQVRIGGSLFVGKFVPCNPLTTEALFLWNCAISFFRFWNPNFNLMRKSSQDMSTPVLPQTSTKVRYKNTFVDNISVPESL